ncbi:GreA/GreB family elongation factor [Photobacterium leiognathi]|uniref:GreA/GreB family elongation factor n=1 Tax=Photobacterium leiognathi TaxID=553611 RepID=UPI00387F75C0
MIYVQCLVLYQYSPLGAELIGRKVGDEIHIRENNGKLCWLKIISVEKSSTCNS